MSWDKDSSVPNVFFFLQENRDASPAERAEVLKVDQERRARVGILLLVEEYLAKFPEIAWDRDLQLDLIRHEFRVRRKWGPPPDLAGYVARFPELHEAFLETSFEALDTGEGGYSSPSGPSGPSVEPIEWLDDSTDSGTTPPGSGEYQHPRQIGRYRIERVLGQGAFGIVYLAHDDQLERLVAIKLPHRHIFSEPREIDAYLLEARVLARLEHPAIVPIFDSGPTEDGRFYLVQKYIMGSDLATLLDSRQIPHRETAELVATVAEALHFVHMRRLVHRDVKPGNILVDGKGKPFLTDFGLALREEDFGKREWQGGTISYMSPEQARQEGHLVDGRSDVFSLGAVLYEMLTREEPFRGNDIEEVLERIRTLEVRPPRQTDDTIPRELERICLKALSKRPTDRYSTALDMAEDLRLFLKLEEPKPAEWAGPLELEDAAPIIPRGLRSFDAADAAFFLQLLPGPRGRDGLPESIRFWKSRIEETEADRTFRVGLLYGPSGCGKSSLSKAGVLPRLAEHVASVLVEAAPDHTERRLLAALRQRCPGLDACQSLTQALTAIRLGGAGPGRKVLIVLDQVEQWLHGRTEFQETDLVRALRQCDGRRLQCLAIVRDDFWMAATRFMQELDSPLEEGENSGAVHLFDPRHARKVLTLFGRAFEALPSAPAELTSSQASFIESAVEGLATEGKVIPARLALFVEMFKGKVWSPAALREMGGAEGVGVRFLEETFGGVGSPPLHRLHRNGARRVLRALLPEPGSNLKGHMRSRSELFAAAGPEYTRGARSFEDLLRVLDGDLRLLTPVELEPSEDGGDTPAPTERYYQLTHDDLVPPVREWLTREDRRTLRGRLRLRLAERAALWRSRGERRQLPSLLESAGILLLTRSGERTTPERRVLRAAVRHHAGRCGAVLMAILLLALCGFEAWKRHQAESLYRALVISELPRVAELVEREIGPNRRWMSGLLRDRWKETTEDDVRLRLSLALLPEDGGQTHYLRGRLLEAGPEELQVIRAALAGQDELIKTLWHEVENEKIDARRFRAACALALYEPESPRWARSGSFLAAQLVMQHPLELDRWIEVVAPASRIVLPYLKEHGAGLNATAALSSYLAGDREEILRLLRRSSAAQFGVFIKNLMDEPSVNRLKAELALPMTSGDGEAGVRERTNIALALLVASAGSAEAWESFRPHPDPRLRTFLIHSVVPFGLEAGLIVGRLLEERDESLRRSLLLVLGEYSPGQVPERSRERLMVALMGWFETDPDPGVHSAAEWVLRRWGQKDLVQDATKKLKAASRSGRRWYVTQEGHTMALLPSPGAFQPDAEGIRRLRDLQKQSNEGRPGNHQLYRGISSRFAAATKEITVNQFFRFLRAQGGHQERIARLIERIFGPRAPDLDGADGERPVHGLHYEEAIEYCNWLSLMEGLEPCYAAVPGGYRVDLARTGYRLPLYAEWEFACRAGTGEGQARTHFGTKALADAYAWFGMNAEEESHPVGRLKPNDFGLFDVHGNVAELCKCCEHESCNEALEQGGAFLQSYFYYIEWTKPFPVSHGAKLRTMKDPNPRTGFRIVRTIP